MGRLFGTDGVRGIANEQLSCELAMSIGRAAATILTDKAGNTPKVLIGYDTRISSEMLASAVVAGLCSMGAESVLLGVTSTPAVAFLVSTSDADAGIMISASHNTSEYNGIKIFSGKGYKLPDELEEKIESLVLDGDAISPCAGKVGRVYFKNMLSEYEKHLLSVADGNFSNLKVALDCSNGSASATAPELFKKLGASVCVLSAEPDGYNINLNCGSTHIDALQKYVVDNKCDIGFAFDGDADRCLCVDEKGNIIDGDFILAMCALDMKKSGKLKNNTVVGTIMTNFGFGQFCKDNGISFTQTKVGDRYVLEEMCLGDFIIGGEQSGHIIFKEHATTGDGQLTAVKVISLMSKTGKSLSALADVMTRFPQKTVNIKVSAEGKLRVFTDENIQNIISKAQNELGENGRVVVRPSGTEPLIRIMVEGLDEKKISELASLLAKRIEKELL